MFKILELNPALQPYESYIKERMDLYEKAKKTFLPKNGTLLDFANAHQYFGFHHVENGWVYREWAPGAYGLYLMGDFNGWHKTSHPLKKLEEGIWEIFLEGDEALWDGCKVKVIVDSSIGRNERLPLYTRYAVQDKKTLVWTSVVLDDKKTFKWTDEAFQAADEPLMVYEAHVGMAQEEAKVGTYREFADIILPKIKKAGYNTIQLMAIMEHPYYASFGYQISNFYASSSWFGKPDDLKRLINKAHKLGIRVLLDIVHSHAVKNYAEGINMFDGTVYQFFHDGMKGEHPAWGTKCFNYAAPGVVHFLLSNLKFWMEEYHFDGFRFDGITSMIYHNHGLGVSFDSNDKYFSENTHTEAITYLQLANTLIREINPKAITIAEDMSGMPGMCLPIKDGGVGFDYRLSMGLPDLWIHMAHTESNLDWKMQKIWREFSLCRPEEKTVAYMECHDQALVGDQTIIFRLAGASMYNEMGIVDQSAVAARAIALHKIFRLFTISAGGEGYLNFMGNEFGHPEWIDFPREGNDWSFQHCRRQWSLQDNKELKYRYLSEFDRDMLKAIKKSNVLNQPASKLLLLDEERKIIVYSRKGHIFAYNFHPDKTHNNVFVQVPSLKNYSCVLSTDDKRYGGENRLQAKKFITRKGVGQMNLVKIQIPAQSALILKEDSEEETIVKTENPKATPKKAKTSEKKKKA